MYALADPLKATLARLFGFTHEQLYGSLKDVIDPRYQITPRHALQWMGTDVVKNDLKSGMPRDIASLFWVNRTLQIIQDDNQKHGSFNNENSCETSKENFCETSKENSNNNCTVDANNICITDGRVKTEFDAIKKQGYTTILVTRPDEKKELISEEARRHESESLNISHSNFDYVIQNDKSLSALYANVDNIVDKKQSSS